MKPKLYTYRCKCKAIIGALSQEKLDKAIERHKKECKGKIKSENLVKDERSK
jgi:hypothetical protein